MSKRIGLPVTLKMRHDAHYVETLTSYSGASIGRMIPIEKIRPNPDQPRKFIGDVTELANSIREKGVLEPLLVRYVPREDTLLHYFRRAPLPRLAGRRPARIALHREDRRRRGNARNRADREPAAQRPDALRRSRRLAAAGRPFRLHARRHRQEDRPRAFVGDRIDVSARDSRGSAQRVRRRRNRLEIAAPAGRAAAQRKKDARNGAPHRHAAVSRATKRAAPAGKKPNPLRGRSPFSSITNRKTSPSTCAFNSARAT